MSPAPTTSAAGPLRLRVPGRSLVLVAGVPGAGKSTLLRGLPPRPGVRVLDSESYRNRFARVLPGTPYARVRPLVHLLHRSAAILAAAGRAPTVVVHLPATGRGLRRGALRLARATGRSAHLVWVDAAPEEAVRGQARRGRMVAGRSFARHVVRAEGVAARIADGRLDEPWAGAVVLDRGAAAHGLDLLG